VNNSSEISIGASITPKEINSEVVIPEVVEEAVPFTTAVAVKKTEKKPLSKIGRAIAGFGTAITSVIANV